MFGPPALTRFVYVVAVLAFFAVISYAVYYNLKMKARDKELGMRSGASGDTPSKIRAEKQANERAKNR